MQIFDTSENPLNLPAWCFLKLFQRRQCSLLATRESDRPLPVDRTGKEAPAGKGVAHGNSCQTGSRAWQFATTTIHPNKFEHLLTFAELGLGTGSSGSKCRRKSPGWWTDVLSAFQNHLFCQNHYRFRLGIFHMVPQKHIGSHFLQWVPPNSAVSHPTGRASNAPWFTAQGEHPARHRHAVGAVIRRSEVISTGKSWR